MTSYWINTKGKDRYAFEIKNEEGENVEPADFMKMMYGLKKCSRFTYFLFNKTKINLLAEDKFAWLRN